MGLPRPNLFDHKLETELFYGKSVDSAPTFRRSLWLCVLNRHPHCPLEALKSTSTSTRRSYASTQPISLQRSTPWHICLLLSHPLPRTLQMGFSVPSTPLSLRDMQKIAQSPHIQLSSIHYERQLFNQHAAAGSPSHAPNQFVHNLYEIFPKRRNTSFLGLNLALTERNHGPHGILSHDFRLRFLLPFPPII